MNTQDNPARSKKTWVYILSAFVFLKISLHVILNAQWSFHRDELLYLALGRHLAWGYASVPPAIGFWAWFGDSVLGGSVGAIRLIATLFGSITVLMTGLIAKEIWPTTKAPFTGNWSMTLIGMAGITAGAFLRPSMLFMPVVFDVFYWTLLCWIFIKYINTNDTSWLLYFGFTAGLGLLNKYTVLIFLFSMLSGLLLTSYRKIFSRRQLYYAIGSTLLILSPNIYWQYTHSFPVFEHMSKLSATQFSHVSLSGFAIDQLLFFLPALPIWIAGLYVLLICKETAPWRIFGWMYLMVILILLAFSAKSYYSIGAYPVLIAAGAVYLENKTQDKWRMIRYILPGWMILFGLINLPASLPLLPPAKEARFVKVLTRIPGMEGILRWEDGRQYDLPQDFADMLGWKEIALHTGKTWQNITDKKTAGIYAENYGQAGAIEHFGKPYDLPQVLSFSDSYRYWLPDTLPADFQTLIYVNDELGSDMPGYFQKIEKVFELDMPLSRQHGTQIYLCQYPTPAFFDRMNNAFKLFKTTQPSGND